MRLFINHNDKSVYISHPNSQEFKTRYDVFLKYSNSFTLSSCGEKTFSPNDVFAEATNDNRMAGMIIGGIIGLLFVPLFFLLPLITGGLAYMIEEGKFKEDLKKVEHFNNHFISEQRANKN